ncbi:MAG: osteoblast specific factor 2-related protein [Fimbriimonadales bacterium]|nr:MAG: osteoblast specific factor 2-related protein [Fimbriimonadales bacterium]
MTMKQNKWMLAFVPVAVIALAAMMPREKKDIVDTASANSKFSTLVAAVKAATLVEALKSEGPFTVFAPTNEAFEKLEKAKPGTLETLLKPENKELLQTVLKYHVVPAKFMAADVVRLKDGTKVKTLAKKEITVYVGEGVKVNNAKVIQTDVECTNGVIHVIDTVLLPPQ